MDAIRIGYVSAIEKESGMVSVVYPEEDDTATDYLPYLAPGNEYFPPKVDDMVLVVYHSGGAQGVCLGTYWNRDNLPAFVGGAQKTFSKDSYIRYDKDRDTIEISASDIVLKCAGRSLSVCELIKG